MFNNKRKYNAIQAAERFGGHCAENKEQWQPILFMPVRLVRLNWVIWPFIVAGGLPASEAKSLSVIRKQFG